MDKTMTSTNAVVSAPVANDDNQNNEAASAEDSKTTPTIIAPTTVIEWSVLQSAVGEGAPHNYQFQPLILTVGNQEVGIPKSNDLPDATETTQEVLSSSVIEESNNDSLAISKTDAVITEPSAVPEPSREDAANATTDVAEAITTLEASNSNIDKSMEPTQTNGDKNIQTTTTREAGASSLPSFQPCYWDPDPSTRCPGFWRCPVMVTGSYPEEGPHKMVNTTDPCWAVDLVDRSTILAAKAQKQPPKKGSDKKKNTMKDPENISSVDTNTLLVASDNNDIPRIPNSVAFRNAQNAFQLRLSHEANLILPNLLWQAVLEECQAAWFQTINAADNDQQQPRQQQIKNMSSSSDFRYYSHSPNQYLPATTSTANTLTASSASTPTGFPMPVSFTPSALLQRVKQGCALAWQEEFSGFQQLQEAYAFPSSSRRTSTRRNIQQNAAVGVSTLSSSKLIDERHMLKVKPGGRVALYLLEKMDLKDRSINNLAMGRIDDNGEGKSDDDEGEEKVDEDDETVLVIENPFLKPSRTALMEWMGRKMSKSWTTSDAQPFFARDFVYHRPIVDGKKKKTTKAAPSIGSKGVEPAQLFLQKIDCLVWSHMLLKHKSATNQMLLDLPRRECLSEHSLNAPFSVSEFLFSPGQQENTQFPRISLQVVGYSGDADDSISDDIGEWETATFGRTQFTVRLFHDVAEQELIEHHLKQAEMNAQKQKEIRLWETYRYKGIQSGFCQWGVNWIEAAAASETLKESVDEGFGVSEPVMEVDNVDVNADLSLARSLAAEMSHEEFSSSGQRRKTRRTGESGGVFYGNQSNMTQKQLMDSLLRLISSRKISPGTKPFQTLIGLLQGTPEESSDPMRRIRLALGRLLWKRNQVSCLNVSVQLSDKPVWTILQNGPLWILSQDKGNDTMKNDDGAIIEMESEVQDEKQLEDEFLVQYIRTIHQTELILRNMVMECITDIPVAVIATAADEKPGSMESMDQTFFQDVMNVQWRVSGHELLDSEILRPPTIHSAEDSAPCSWYRVTDFAPTIFSEDDGSGAEQVSIGRAKEPHLAERRIRFRAVPMEGNSNGESSLILTEAQVRAGILAAKKDRLSRSVETTENPFAASVNAELSLIPETETREPITGIVVGHESIIDSNNRTIHKVLVMPKKENTSRECFWLTLDYCSTTSCSIDGDCCKFTIQQFDYTSSSQAYQECLDIVKYLERHPRGSVFQEPVDPIALGIPDYPTIVKNPMDVSTLKMKLERGDYANIPPSHMRGANPVARMINGPFRSDVELIFDNAMLFNPPDDWIHQAASSIKKSVLKKIEQATSTSENILNSRKRKPKSLYVDYDSDVDLYVYESDEDDEFGTSRSKRKRKSAANTPPKEDASSRPMERSIRLQRVMSESMGLRGPFANIPISSDASQFSLPMEWKCKYSQDQEENEQEKCDNDQNSDELDELVALHRQALEADHMGLRRSTRASDGLENGVTSFGRRMDEFTYFIPGHEKRIGSPKNRMEIEQTREILHENFFAKRFRDKFSDFVPSSDNAFNWGSFSDGSFPPYLGRVVPSLSPYLPCSQCMWEIREPFIIPALRWILRGLINSDHLKELEPLDSTTGSGAIIPNHIYYIDEKQQPYDILDAKELTRRKRVNEAGENSSESEVELSEYEKAREERVARNRERLKELGLA